MIKSIKLRRYFARVTLPFLTIWLCVLPSKSYAVVPALALIPLAAEAIAADGSAVVLAEMTAQQIANTVGMTWASINFYKLSESARVTVPVKIANAVQPNASATISYPQQFRIKLNSSYVAVAGQGNTYTLQRTDHWGVNFLDICASVGGSPDSFGSTCTYSFPSSLPSDNGSQTTTFTASDLIQVNPCPSGYSVSGAGVFFVCNLISGDSAVQDNAVNLTRTSSGFSMNEGDADLLGLNHLFWSGTPLAPTPAADSPPPQSLPTPVPRNAAVNSLLSAMFITGTAQGVQAFGKSPSGVNTLYQVDKRPDNGTDFYVLTPTTLADGSAGTNYLKLSLSPNGVVESATNVKTAEKLQVSTAPNPNPATNPDNDPAVDPLPVIEYPYLVPAGQTSPTYDPLVGGVPQLTPVGNPVPYTSTNGSPSGATFPSDYARQGEAKNAADSLAPKLDKIGDALSKDATSTPDPTAVDETTMPTFDTTFDNLKGWRLPPHASVCPKPQMTLFGNNYTLSSHCDLLNQYGSPLHQAMVTVFTVLALFIVLRA
jgi:hypothetical protein